MRGVEPGREERTRHEEREAEGEAREQKRKRSRAEWSESESESEWSARTTNEENTRDTPPYIGCEAWQTSEWEMLGRTGRERKRQRGEGERPRAVLCAAAAEAERNEARNEARGVREKREKRASGGEEGERPRREKRRAAQQSRRCAVRSGRKRESEEWWEMLGRTTVYICRRDLCVGL